jgi:hypothetical protein
MQDQTFEQSLASALIQAGEPLPVDLCAKLVEQGVILDEFIESNLK